MQAVKNEQFTENYQVKNLLLTQPADWYIDENTLKAVKESEKQLTAFFKTQGKESLPNTPIKKIIKKHYEGVYSTPLFSEIFCDIFNDELKNLKEHFNFNPNPEEDELRQIPEIVLQECVPDIYKSLMYIAQTILNPIFITLWGRTISEGGVQIANYNLIDKQQGAWHHDSSADISVVVPLNTGEYKGGGTEFQGKGIVEPIPTGNALMFPSFTHMHRGLAVDSGNRYLLVFWLVNKESIEDKKNNFNFIYN
jgi:hypothetical protein|tara:strand:+ start:38 stop:793 length:756 start_codon:yes stop_codon:yes gene_type:complete